MSKLRACAAFTLIIGAPAGHAQALSADRPGIGVGPDIVPQWTFQPEIGTDGQELRLGILKGVEADYQRGGGDSAAGVKLALTNGPAFKAALRLTYDRQLHTTLEVPANITLTPWFSLGLDAQWARHSQTYSAGFNFQPTRRLTITPEVYYDTRPRAALFAAWALRDNLQFDIGYDQHKVALGVSTAFDLSRMLRRR